MPSDGLFEKSIVTEAITLDSFYRADKPFLIVCYGAGKDSSGLLVLLALAA